MRNTTIVNMNNKMHYAWIIMIACFIFYAALVGMLYNCRGLFYTAMSEDLGWKYSSVALGSVFMGLAAVPTLKIVPKLYSKYSVKWVLAVSGALYALTYVFWAFTPSLLIFYIICAFMGAFSAFIVYVPLPMIMNSWFVKSKGLALGFASLSSGVGAAISSPIVTGWITNWGWQKAVVVDAAAAAAIAVPVIIFFIVGKPENKGLLPYGVSEKYKDAVTAAQGTKDPKPENSGTVNKRIELPSRYTKKEKAGLLLLCTIYAMLSQLIAGFSVQLPHVSTAAGLTLAVGGMLTSVCSIGNMAGKAAGGVSLDKLGNRTSAVIGIAVTIMGFLLLLLGEDNMAFLIVGSVAVGIAAFISTMIPPAMIDSFSKGDEYVTNMSQISMGTMLASAFTSYLPGIIRDMTGAYTAVYLLYIVFSVAALVIALLVFKRE